MGQTSTAIPARRRFLQVAAASLAAAPLATGALANSDLPFRFAPAAHPYVPPAPQLNPILAAARVGLIRSGAKVRFHDVVAVADFAQPSRLPRFHMVDTTTGAIETLLVAHGRGSDPSHTGWLQSFSNLPGSAATSQGDYATGDDYVGEHGRSMRLHGLDPSNSNALDRNIVVHAAWYVGPNIVQREGRLGCSEGCFAFSDADVSRVLERLGPGRLLVATRL